MRREIAATYDYADENGGLLYQVVRWSPKGFSQRRPDGVGGWSWELKGTRRVLYRLRDVVDAVDRAVFVVEGEKDADTLASLGLVATCNAGGAGKWRADYSTALMGRVVYVVPDNDEPGRRHAEDVAHQLAGIAAELRVVSLPGLAEHQDVSDWLSAGHTIADLKAVVRETPIWSPTPPSTSVEREVEALPAGVERAGRARLYDLSKYSATAEAAGVDWLIDEWIERGKIHLTAGFEKLGKTTQGLRRIGAVSTGTSHHGHRARPGRAVLVTEMDEAGVLQLIADDAIDLDWSNVRVVFTSDYAPEERLGVIEDVCRGWNPVLLGLDPVDEAFGLDGDAIFNPARAGAPFDLMRSLARAGVAIDAYYHLNNQGRIANSYKFRSKPDHLYEISGSDASETTVKYRGRLRAIPRIRKITGNGIDGYRVETLVGGTKGAGRPAQTAGKVLAVLRNVTEPLGPTAIATAAQLTEEAARSALGRLVASGRANKLDRGLYVAAATDDSEEGNLWEL